MKAWSRDDTKDWINQTLSRVEDLEYYKEQTLLYCENHFIHDRDLIIKCLVATLFWVAAMRSETLTFTEILDFLDVPIDESLSITDRQIHIPSTELLKLNYEELLNMCLNT